MPIRAMPRGMLTPRAMARVFVLAGEVAEALGVLDPVGCAVTVLLVATATCETWGPLNITSAAGIEKLEPSLQHDSSPQQNLSLVHG
jgi:hypothetical protein